MCFYKIPDGICAEKNGYELLSRIYGDVKAIENKVVKIRFSECRQFDANLIGAGCGAILDKLYSEGYDISLSLNKSDDITTVLARIGFLEAWNIKADVSKKENFIIYKRFHKNASNDFKQYIDEWLIKKQRFPRHTKLAGDNILSNIFEIYVNAITHGNTEYVHCCGEYNSKDSTLDMTIVDCGKTIPANVNEFFEKKGRSTVNSCKAIEWAFGNGNTTKSTTGGLGLALLKDFIRMNNGCLHMVSGDAFLEFMGSKMTSYSLEVPFPGTIVNVRFNFDDDKNYYMRSERGKINLNDLL